MKYKIIYDCTWDRPWRILDTSNHHVFGGWTTGENAIRYLTNYRNASIIDIDITEVY